jgi:hypothetical protein
MLEVEILEDRLNFSGVTLFSADPQFVGLHDLATDGLTGFYVSGDNGLGSGFNYQQIFRIGMSGGAATIFAPAHNPEEISTDGTYVYWIDPNGGPISDTAILRTPIAGGPTDPIYIGINFGQPIVDGSGIAFVPGSGSPGTLVTADEVQGRVHRMTATNPVSGLVQLGPNRYGGFFNEEHFNSIATDNGMVYVADSGNPNYGDTPPRVQSIALGGSSFTDLFVGSLPGFAPRGIAVHGGTIYLTSGNQILQMPATGGTPTLLATDPGFASLQGITFFNNALYVVDQHTGSAEIWKVDLNPPTASTFSPSLPPSTASMTAASPVFATGTDAAGLPEVKVYDARTAQPKLEFFAYDPGFTGGVRVAVADISGDGVPDIITGPGPGMAPEIKVFDGRTAALLRDFVAYDPPAFPLVPVFGDAALQRNGLHVAFTAFNGQPAIITGRIRGDAPEVRVFDAASLTLIDDFFAYAPSIPDGVFVGGV